jgi:transketolase
MTIENVARMTNLAAIEHAGRLLRRTVIEMSHAAGTPHLGSSMSCADIVATAYWGVLNIDPNQPDDPLRDRFILSKGHAATTLYAALAHRGFFPVEWLKTEYNTNGGKMAEHPGPRCVPGVEAATGSLGHGLPIGLGMALAARMLGQRFRVFVLLSDGECNEGSVWEAAMLAPAQKLDNVCVIIDHNKWQATARTSETLALSPLAEKWAAFGWDARNVDVHSCQALLKGMKTTSPGKPVALIAHTIKGSGVSFMEDDNNWHYRIPKRAEVDAALIELGFR